MYYPLQSHTLFEFSTALSIIKIFYRSSVILEVNESLKRNTGTRTSFLINKTETISIKGVQVEKVSKQTESLK